MRRAIRETDRLGITDALLAEVVDGFADSYGEHYPHVRENKTLIREEIAKEEEKFRKTLQQGMRELEKMARKGDVTGDQAFVLFTSYGFPVELTEELAKERGLTLDRDAFDQKMKEHQDKSRAGAAQKFAGGLADHQEQTIRYHTAHHLLLAALQKVLGPDVKQRGSNITTERLRIDFSYGAKMTPEQIEEVEKLVNEKIDEDLPVIRLVMAKSEAERLGAQMEFGVKYADTVTVYSIGPIGATEEDPKIADTFSLEFCGGPHAAHTIELREGEKGKVFKIQKEEAVAQGVRRIKGVLV